MHTAHYGPPTADMFLERELLRRQACDYEDGLKRMKKDPKKDQKNKSMKKYIETRERRERKRTPDQLKGRSYVSDLAYAHDHYNTNLMYRKKRNFVEWMEENGIPPINNTYW